MAACELSKRELSARTELWSLRDRRSWSLSRSVVGSLWSSGQRVTQLRGLGYTVDKKKTSPKTAGSPENVRRPKLHLSVKRSLRTAGTRCVCLCALQFVVRCVCMFRPEYIISAQHVLYSFSHVVTTHCVVYNCNCLFGGRYRWLMVFYTQAGINMSAHCVDMKYWR
jgi:hypothetical protein